MDATTGAFSSDQGKEQMSDGQFATRRSLTPCGIYTMVSFLYQFLWYNLNILINENMKNQKVSTLLGTIVLVIFSITAGVLVWQVIKNREIAKQPPQEIADIKKPVVTQVPEVIQQNQEEIKTECNSIANQKNTEKITAIYKYKKIKVSDSYMKFSFQVPETWLSETRHSGDRNLSVDEMRDFLATNYDGSIKTNPKLTSDYADLPWSLLKDMPNEEVVKNYAKNGNSFPNASVSAGKQIWYTDSNGKQIDFYILHDFDRLYTQWNETYKLSNDSVDYKRSTESVNGIVAEVITFAMDKDDCGNEIATKGGSGGKIYFIRFNDKKDMLIIRKQFKGDSQFEDNFTKLLKTLKIEE